ncbi:divergent PAP2 family protein [Lederbergia citrea]|uniref:divergent PAP2 family protein n=1 Tax=Lederbergia citrea TaxID=2833581 RepID=UPI001BCA2EC4|nr:divergent PAP2 family protein [Lederbergia citrea]MBS4178568.1 divergent PAP2 family protein [Lederbergia citrea]
MDLLLNFPLWAAFSAIFFAQLIKVPIHYLVTRKTDWSLLTSTGGMPSSHSAAVTALATAVALDTGLGSTPFAITAIFAMIVMYDAKGIRRQAGEQAAVLNRLSADFQKMLEETKVWRNKSQTQKEKEIINLKELLGHKPIEVFFGGLTGIIWALVLDYIINIL